MNAFMPWVGGKRALREQIVSMFPVFYERYIEVFGGAGWVLFHKNPGNDFEVYNDYNSLLVNFDRIGKLLEDPNVGTEAQRAAWFYQRIRQSYGAALTSFGGRPQDMWASFPLIEQAHRRLAKVVVENQDFERLIRHYDRPVSLFYCDPPYHNTEGFYRNVGEKGFTEEDHIRLRDALLNIQGKFLLSYNDDEFIHRLYDWPDIHIVETTRIHSMRQRIEPSSQFPELIISNFDPYERKRHLPVQMSLIRFGRGDEDPSRRPEAQRLRGT